MSEKQQQQQQQPVLSEKAAEADWPLARSRSSKSERSAKSPPLENALERLNSVCSAHIPVTGTDPLAAGPGAARIGGGQRGVHHHFYFQRLAVDMELPSKTLEIAML